MLPITCVGFAVSLLGVLLGTFMADPTITADPQPSTNFTTLNCTPYRLPWVNFSYGNDLFVAETMNLIAMSCVTTLRTPDVGMLPVTFDVWAPNGSIAISYTTNTTQCAVNATTLASCLITPNVTITNYTPVGSYSASYVHAKAQLWASQSVCRALFVAISATLTAPQSTIKELQPSVTGGQTALISVPLTRTIVNAVGGLPAMMGVSFGSFYAGPQALGITATAPAPTTAQVSYYGNISLPAGATITTELWFANLTCPSSFSCTFAVPTAHNCMLTQANSVNSLVAYFICAISNGVVERSSMSTLAVLGAIYNQINTTVSLTVQSCTDTSVPSLTVLIVTGCGAAVLLVWSVMFAMYNRIKYPVLNNGGKLLPTGGLVFEAFVIALLCCSAIYGLIYIHFTTTATFTVGNEWNLYCFSLATYIQDLFNGGMIPLAVLVAAFTGAYPFLKLLTILIFGVWFPWPQHRLGRLIDHFGTLCFLDSLVILLFITANSAPGVATVKLLPAFYGYLGAIVLSTLLGNYALSGWRRQVRIVSGGKGEGRRISAVGCACCSDDSGEWMHYIPDVQRPWAWAAAIPAFAVVVASVVLTILFQTFSFQIQGGLTSILGTDVSRNIVDFVLASTWPLNAVAIAIIFAAPLLYTLGYPKMNIFASWCGTDTLIIAGAALLFNLQNYVNIILGPQLAPYITISTTFIWPVYILIASAAVQWLLKIWQVISVGGRGAPCCSHPARVEDIEDSSRRSSKLSKENRKP